MASKPEMNTRIVRMNEFDHDLLDYLLRRSGEQDPKPNSTFFNDAKNILLVSYTDGQLSGFLWAHILDSPHTPNPKMFLYSIDVFEEFRRRGIGSMLIQNLKEIAISCKCRAMFVPTSRSNSAAIALYSGTGGKVQDDDGVTFAYDEEALGTQRLVLLSQIWLWMVPEITKGDCRKKPIQTMIFYSGDPGFFKIPSLSLLNHFFRS